MDYCISMVGGDDRSGNAGVNENVLMSHVPIKLLYKMQSWFLSMDFVVGQQMHQCVKSNDKYHLHISVLFPFINMFTTHLSIA